jgi:glutamyl-tRNA synthetase
MLFPHITKTPAEWRAKFPPRKTTAYRIAPSPTGYVHIGTVAMALVDSFLAKQTGGVFYLRLEDTDDKRLVADAVENMRTAFECFGIKFDEGAFDGGVYAPYVQSERTEIYHSFAKGLVISGLAYPCFCAEDELNETREIQSKNNEKTGYYGKYAKCRSLSFADIKQKIAQGCRWTLRADFSKWDSGGNAPETRISWVDCVKGKMSLPAEINDPIILKSNGVPPYNFAHTVDDLLMGTTTVVRGEEWLVSTAQHIQLAESLGENPQYVYAHLPTICIEENGKKRKLSKRKDHGALAMNLIADGYPAAAIIEYLLTIYNTDFELWRIANPNAPLCDFNFKIEKIGTNSPLFDVAKLNDISKNTLSKITNEQVITEFNGFYNKFAPFEMGDAEKERVEKMLCVERTAQRPRKDLIKFADVPLLYDYVFDGFTAGEKRTDAEKTILADYSNNYNTADDKEKWFEKIKQSAGEHGFTLDKNEYKLNPEKYKGTVADFVQIIRTAVTGRDNTPDLWDICRILGEQIVKQRCAV